MDDRKKGPPLTLIADNPSSTIEKQRSRQNLERLEERATYAIRQLVTNLLRVVAGAGEPWALLQNIDDARTAYLNYLDAIRETGHSLERLTRELTLDHLFSWERRRPRPTTEEGWLRWAQPRDPYEEYLEEVSRAKIELRRAALRQVASVLSSGETREPHLKAHGGNLDETIKDILAARKEFDYERSQPPREADPERQAIAKLEITKLRREQRMRQLQSLPEHQIAGLLSVDAGTMDQTDRFTLDVLGSMKLLIRPKGSKKKSEWRLTDEGRLALETHKRGERL